MEDIRTVHYATKDPIQNLKVRVVLTRLSVQRTAPKLPDGSSSPSAAVAVQQQQVGCNNRETPCCQEPWVMLHKTLLAVPLCPQAHPGALPVPPAPGQQQPGVMQTIPAGPGGAAPMPYPLQQGGTAPSNVAPTQQGSAAPGAPMAMSGINAGPAPQQGSTSAAGAGAAADPFKAAERQSRSLPAMAPRVSRISRVGQGQPLGEGKQQQTVSEACV
jgi:hypothetical protein